MGIVSVAFLLGFYYFFIKPYSYRWKPCYGMKAYGVCLPYGYSVHGFDISHHQGEIDWDELQKLPDALRQADFFIRSVDLQPGDLPPVLDIEVKGEDEDKLRRDLSVWLRRVEQYYKVKPILYTSYKFKTRYLNDSLFNTYPYWIAHYYVDSVEYKGQWRFWQHTDVGKLPGIRENVDLNVFNGSLEELRRLTIPFLNEE